MFNVLARLKFGAYLPRLVKVEVFEILLEAVD
jgi:hypothetical protein